jgi:hypothetical protein
MTIASASIFTENYVTIVRGSSKTLELTVTDTSSPPKHFNLTGAKILMTVKSKAEDRDPLIFKTSDDPLQAAIIKPQCGVARIYLVPADTQNLAIRQYQFDVWTILANGKRYPVVPPSVFEVIAGVTVVAL